MIDSDSIHATITFATTTTTTEVVQPNLDKRSAVTASASFIPAYASPCSGATITVYVSSTVTATVDVYSTSTSIAVSTSSTAANTPPTCTPDSPAVSGAGISYINIFTGYGVTENPDNPSNEAIPDVTTFSGSLNDCEAADACATYVWNTANNDYSFDLHYLIAEKQRYCVGYYDARSSSDDFNVVDPNVGVAYLFEY